MRPFAGAAAPLSRSLSVQVKATANGCPSSREPVQLGYSRNPQRSPAGRESPMQRKAPVSSPPHALLVGARTSHRRSIDRSICAASCGNRLAWVTSQAGFAPRSCAGLLCRNSVQHRFRGQARQSLAPSPGQRQRAPLNGEKQQCRGKGNADPSDNRAQARQFEPD